MIEQKRQRFVDRRGGDGVVVVEHERNRGRQGGEGIDQQGQDGRQRRSLW